jgi:transposase-like protein
MSRHRQGGDREQFWRRHFERQRISGSTIRAYCRTHGLHEAAFYFWRRTIAERNRMTSPVPKAAAAPTFVPVAVVDAPVSPRRETPIDILLTDGRRVRVRSGCDRSLLVDVLAVLDAATSRKSPAAASKEWPC